MARLRNTLFAVTAASALVLAGCSSDGDKSAKNTGGNEDSRGPITFAMGKNDTDKITPIIEKWNKEHPEEKVELKELAGEADAQRETLVQALQASSTDYDVMALDVVWTAQFAANGWIAPITGDLKIDTSKLLPSTVESATYNGSLYAVPQNTNGQLLFRNTKFAKEEPKKWEDLLKQCEAAKAEKVDCLQLTAKQYEGLTVTTTNFINGWGGSVVKEDGKTPDLKTPEAKAGLQALVDAYGKEEIAKTSTAATEEQVNLAFTEGKTAFAINWPYMYDTSKEAAAVKDNFEVSPLVGPDGVGASTLGGYNNGININSKHKATARDFIEFIINDENQASFAEASFPPVLASIYEDQDLVKKYPYLPALKTSLENAKPRPVSPFYDAISKAIQDNAYAALTAKKPVDEALNDMTSAIEQAGNR